MDVLAWVAIVYFVVMFVRWLFRTAKKRDFSGRGNGQEYPAREGKGGVDAADVSKQCKKTD